MRQLDELVETQTHFLVEVRSIFVLTDIDIGYAFLAESADGR